MRAHTPDPTPKRRDERVARLNFEHWRRTAGENDVARFNRGRVRGERVREPRDRARRTRHHRRGRARRDDRAILFDDDASRKQIQVLRGGHFFAKHDAAPKHIRGDQVRNRNLPRRKHAIGNFKRGAHTFRGAQYIVNGNARTCQAILHHEREFRFEARVKKICERKRLIFRHHKRIEQKREQGFLNLERLLKRFAGRREFFADDALAARAAHRDVLALNAIRVRERKIRMRLRERFELRVRVQAANQLRGE